MKNCASSHLYASRSTKYRLNIKTKRTAMLEINVRNLIAHCEELAKEEPTSWRLKKYIKSLDTMIDELQSSDQ